MRNGDRAWGEWRSAKDSVAQGLLHEGRQTRDPWRPLARNLALGSAKLGFEEATTAHQAPPPLASCSLVAEAGDHSPGAPLGLPQCR
jgi:hypothetical protein